MTADEEELSDYMSFSTPTRRPSIFRQHPYGKRLTGAMVVAALSCAAIGIVVTSRMPHSRPAIAGSPPVSWPRSPLYSSPPSPSGSTAIPSEDAVSPLSGGSAEYLSADLPTRASYHPQHGAHYDADHVSFGPADGTVTRTGLGEYTVDFPRLADNRSIIDIRAYASRAICYTIEQRVVGVDEQVRVHCVRLVRAFPMVTTSTDSRYTIAVIQPRRPG